jgi:Ca2+-binding EF-hand superfamily protein
MGNSVEYCKNDEELRKFMKPGITLEDLINLRKAFNLLDKEKTGLISYDIKKILESKKLFKNIILQIVQQYNNIVVDNGNVVINFDQFMEIMTNNILNNRSKYGSDKIVFESGK